jgi:hypothetical protein
VAAPERPTVASPGFHLARLPADGCGVNRGLQIAHAGFLDESAHAQGVPCRDLAARPDEIQTWATARMPKSVHKRPTFRRLAGREGLGFMQPAIPRNASQVMPFSARIADRPEHPIDHEKARASRFFMLTECPSLILGARFADSLA